MKNKLIILACAALPIMISATNQANAHDFAEDFSNETALWTVNFFDDNGSAKSEDSDVLILDESIQLRVATGDSTLEEGLLTAPSDSDSGIIDLFKATVQPDSASVIGEDGALQFDLTHHFYNTLSNFGFPEREGLSRLEGDVRVSLRLQFLNTSSFAEVCINERDFEGRLQELTIFSDNTESCSEFSIEPILGESYELELSIDRDLSEMTARINDEEQTFIVPGPTNLFANRQEPFVRAVAEGENNLSVLNIFAIETDRFVDDYRIKGAPRIPLVLDDEDGRVFITSGSGTRPFIDDGTLVMEINSDDGSREQSRLDIVSETDYLEALLSLSSETNFTPVEGEEITALTRLSGSQYDVFADGGLDDSGVGIAWGRIEIYQNNDLSVGARYCLERFDTDAPDFLSTPLLASGVLCEDFVTVPELDTFYKTVIVTDREARTVTFSIDDESVVHNIVESEIFQEGIDRQFNAVRSLINDASGTVVSFADDFRTDPNALTRDELRAAAQIDTDEVSDSSGGGGSVNIYFSMLLLLFGLVSLAVRRVTENLKS